MSHSSTTGSFFRKDTGTVLPPQNGRNRGKKTLVLDLDETLVHSAFQPVTGHDIMIPVACPTHNFRR